MKQQAYLSQQGVTLIAGLVFLFIITLMVAVAFKGSQLNFQIQSNQKQSDDAMQAADGGTYMFTSPQFNIIKNYLDNRHLSDPWSAFTLPSEIQPSSANSIDINLPGESLSDPNSLATDAIIKIDNLESEIQVFAGQGGLNPGNNIAQFSGYDGLGKGIANAGSVQYFSIRATGVDAQNPTAKAVTHTTYRHIIMNQ